MTPQEARIERKLAHLRGRDLRADTERWVKRCCWRTADDRKRMQEIYSITLRNALPGLVRNLYNTSPLLSRLIGRE